MKLKPVGHRLIVKPVDIDKAMGLSVSEDLKKLGFTVQTGIGEADYVKMATDRGIVTSVGPMAWKHPDYGYPSQEWKPWCKVGDEIVFGKYAGKLVTDPETQEEYFVINDEDVQLLVQEA